MKKASNSASSIISIVFFASACIALEGWDSQFQFQVDATYQQQSSVNRDIMMTGGGFYGTLRPVQAAYRPVEEALFLTRTPFAGVTADWTCFEDYTWAFKPEGEVYSGIVGFADPEFPLTAQANYMQGKISDERNGDSLDFGLSSMNGEIGFFIMDTLFVAGTYEAAEEDIKMHIGLLDGETDTHTDYYGGRIKWLPTIVQGKRWLNLEASWERFEKTEKNDVGGVKTDDYYNGNRIKATATFYVLPELGIGPHCEFLDSRTENERSNTWGVHLNMDATVHYGVTVSFEQNDPDDDAENVEDVVSITLSGRY